MKNKKDLISKISLMGTGVLLALSLNGCGGGAGSTSDTEYVRNLTFKDLPANTLFITNPQTEQKKIRDINGQITISPQVKDQNGDILPLKGIKTNVYICDSQDDNLNNCYNVEESLDSDVTVDLTDLGGKYLVANSVDSNTGNFIDYSIGVDKNDAPVLNSSFDLKLIQDGFVGDNFPTPTMSDYTDSEGDIIELIKTGSAVDYLNEMGVFSSMDPVNADLSVIAKDQYGAESEEFLKYFQIKSPLIIPDKCLYGDLEILIGENLDSFPNSIVAWNEKCNNSKIISTCVYNSQNNTVTLDPKPGASLTCETKVPLDCVGPDGRKIAHADYINYFLEPFVDSNEICVSQNRTCIDGVLTGSFTNATCNVESTTCIPSCPSSDNFCPGQIYESSDDGCGGSCYVSGTSKNCESY